ncbi:MAG: hypothetical protein HUU49_03040 [Candidatus Buchananbacteria bacterium]|nr:hypothetical protein [Candidatus Buchananbacteria bacterium]
MKKFFISFCIIVIAGVIAFFIYQTHHYSSPALAASQPCTDYETTRNYYTKGSVVTCNASGECSGFIVDECSDNMLTDYYCENGEIKSEQYICPNNCQDGRCIRGRNCKSNSDCLTAEFCEFQGCSGEIGSCVAVTSSCSKIYDPVCGCDQKTYGNNCERQKVKVSPDHTGRCGVACTETDSKKDYRTRGSITGYDINGNAVNRSDECVNSLLREYYCDSDQLAAYVDYDCPNGCSNGTCIVVVAPEPILGCMDTKAKNYNAKATKDDGSCQYEILGCMDRQAVNYNQVATKNDGSCRYAAANPQPQASSTLDFVEQERRLVGAIDTNLAADLAGRILLQVESRGEAWYVAPGEKKKFYLKNGNDAYAALRSFGLGITTADLAKIPLGLESRAIISDQDADGLDDTLEEVLGTSRTDADSDDDGFTDAVEIKNNFNPLSKSTEKNQADISLVNRLRGRILLQVESRGEAWYVNPADGKRYYMKDGVQAYQMMKFLSLGVTNENLRRIEVGILE